MTTDRATEEVFCTKYALSRGVFKVTGHENDNYFFYIPEGCTSLQNLLRAGEWARTQEEAVAQVKAMVARRRKALLKENNKLLRVENGLVQGELPMAKEKK